MSLIPSGFAKSAAGGTDGNPLYDYKIEQSLRFNDDDNAYLSRTPSSAGNRKTWTWSGWVKRGAVTTTNGIFEAYDSGGASFFLGFRTSTEDLAIAATAGVSPSWGTSAKFRDPSAWYHIVAVVDTTSATSTITNGSTDRIRLYVNGVQQTLSGGTVPSQNADLQVNSTLPHHIGRFQAGGFYNDGYLAEVHFIDGQALDASSFGETKSGVWIPKAYSGSYGTNGFYLDFDGTYYNDKSGNGNNFTANNLAATDVVLDSPTNNFATLNPLVYSDTANTFTEGNLKASSSGNNQQVATIAMQGKVYWEFLDLNGNGALYFSDDSEFTTEMYYNATNRASIWNDGTSGATGSLSWTVNSGSLFSWTTNDLIGVAYDADNHTLQLTKNGGSAVNLTINGLSGDTMLAVHGNRTSSSSTVVFANFGQDSSFAGNKTAQGNTDDNGYGDFYYAPPTGYLALCTANLEVPDAMNPALDNSPQDYFNTVLYTGNGSTQSITGVGFQPDWVWLKERDGADGHGLFDSVRGATKWLGSEGTYAEGTYPTMLTSFDTDGFSLGSWSGFNESGRSMVSWNWKANGSGVSNTDGSITSTVSANTDAGFSIVSYTGNGTAGATIGHGIGDKVDFIIVKNRSSLTDWQVYHHKNTSEPATDYIRLNQTGGTSDNIVVWNDTEPTSSVFTVGSNATVNTNGDNYVAYCWAEVEGFSKFGSYTGNGSTDGTFVYTGFRPAFVMYKNITSSNSWRIADSQRGTNTGSSDAALWANESSAEFTNGSYDIDFLSNGFKCRESNYEQNGSSTNYIFMAFAENPFKYANAR